MAWGRRLWFLVYNSIAPRSSSYQVRPLKVIGHTETEGQNMWLRERFVNTVNTCFAMQLINLGCFAMLQIRLVRILPCTTLLLI
jgi:hypothetical protein